jgi:ribosomal-protein-alanine N-acetyltransferase
VEDIPKLIAIDRSAATAAHWTADLYRGLFQASGRQTLALVIEETGTIRGLLIAQAVGDEWELENIVVDPGSQRRGLGSLLMTGFLYHVRVAKGRVIHLEVRDSNHAARALYERWGFSVSGRRSRYYIDPEEDAAMYRLVIEPHATPRPEPSGGHIPL